MSDQDSDVAVTDEENGDEEDGQGSGGGESGNEKEHGDDETSDNEKLAQMGESDDEKVKETAEEEEEEEEKFPENPLTLGHMPECLTLLAKIGNGLSHAYVRLDIRERDITNIDVLKGYVHLRYVDVSKNELRDISSISNLKNLLVLNASENKLKTAELDTLPYLQVANFSNNNIKKTTGINHPLLELLSLSYNELSEIELDASSLLRLHTLELRGNRIESTAGLYLQNLRNLFLASNGLKSLEGIGRLASLTTLHLRDNHIENLDGFSAENKHLQYINLRGNQVQTLSEVDKVQCIPTLRALILSENPVADEEEYRLEVVIRLRRLERLDKDEYSEEERQEAEEISNQREMEENIVEADEGD